MFWKKKKHAALQESADQRDLPTVPVSLSDVKTLVREFERQLPKGINRTILVGQDNEINFKLLTPLLSGVPDRKYYMSKETFEIFEEEDRHIPVWLDIVQRAVDDYIAEENVAPTVPGDRNKKISMVLLQNNYYLKERPPLDFYLTDLEDMVTHIPLDK